MKVPRGLLVVAVIAIFALILSCATAGREFDRTHVNDVRTGAQDKNQIRSWFGEPYRVQPITNSPIGCIERWTYVHSYSSFGGAKTTTSTLVVDFNKKGKVCDHAYVEQ